MTNGVTYSFRNEKVGEIFPKGSSYMTSATFKPSKTGVAKTLRCANEKVKAGVGKARNFFDFVLTFFANGRGSTL